MKPFTLQTKTKKKEKHLFSCGKFIPREKIETPFILILIGDKSKNISKHTMNSMISMNSSDANMAGEKRDRSETDDNGVRSETDDNGVPLKRQRPPPPPWVVEYERFTEWCANYVDDPSLPPIQVMTHGNLVRTRDDLTSLQTEAVLRATFEKYGPVESVSIITNKIVLSPNFGKPHFAWIKFARDGDSALAREGESWRRRHMREKREREALLAH